MRRLLTVSAGTCTSSLRLKSVQVSVPSDPYLHDNANCLIGEVHVKKGDTVAADDVLYSLELDKMCIDIVAPSAGTVTTVVESGTVCSPGVAVAVISSRNENMGPANEKDVWALNTTESWRAAFEENLEELQRTRSWGRSLDIFKSMSTLPNELVKAPWRAAAAHNAGCAALRLGQHHQAAGHFDLALQLRSDETGSDDSFAAVETVSRLGFGMCLLAQHALGAEEASSTSGLEAATGHLVSAYEACARHHLASVHTATGYYASLSSLCSLAASRDSAGHVRATDANACLNQVTKWLSFAAASPSSPPLHAERAHHLLEDVNRIFAPTLQAALAALSTGDDHRLVPWPAIPITRAHFGGIVPLIGLSPTGTPVVETVSVIELPKDNRRRRDKPNQTNEVKERPSSVSLSSTSSCLRASPYDLGQLLRECCADKSKPLLAITGSGLSRSCGLPTRQELWSGEEFDRDLDVTACGKHANPDRLWHLVHDFYGKVDFKPPSYLVTQAHLALDKMVNHVPGGVVVTQNVDSLHRTAHTVHEVHGSLHRFRCDHCGDVQKTVSLGPQLDKNRGQEREAKTAGNPSALGSGEYPKDLEGIAAMELYEKYVPRMLSRSGGGEKLTSVCRACGTQGRVRPDVVLFGEGARVPTSVMAVEGAEAPTVFGAILVVGTAGDVFPSSAIALFLYQKMLKRCCSRE